MPGAFIVHLGTFSIKSVLKSALMYGPIFLGTWFPSPVEPHLERLNCSKMMTPSVKRLMLTIITTYNAI